MSGTSRSSWYEPLSSIQVSNECNLNCISLKATLGLQCILFLSLPGSPPLPKSAAGSARVMWYPERRGALAVESAMVSSTACHPSPRWSFDVQPVSAVSMPLGQRIFAEDTSPRPLASPPWTQHHFFPLGSSAPQGRAEKPPSPRTLGPVPVPRGEVLPHVNGPPWPVSQRHSAPFSKFYLLENKSQEILSARSGFCHTKEMRHRG